MDSKKKSHNKKKEPLEFRYEDLLDGLSMEEEDDASKDSSEVVIHDMDDQALAELLGEEPVLPKTDNGIEIVDAGAENDRDLEKEHEKLEPRSISEELVADPVSDGPGTDKTQETNLIREDTSDTEIKEPEFVMEEDQGGYASLLSQLEDDQKEGEFSGLKESEQGEDLPDLGLDTLAGLDLEELTCDDEETRPAERKAALSVTDTQELPSLDDDMAIESPVMGVGADKKISDFTEEHEKTAPETDFLGLSGIQSKPDKFGKLVFTSTEVLFDGVEMDFDQQVDAVTRGELLLAQGKRREAAEVFQHLSDKKGVTHWVSKRLRMLTVPEK